MCRGRYCIRWLGFVDENIRPCSPSHMCNSWLFPWFRSAPFDVVREDNGLSLSPGQLSWARPALPVRGGDSPLSAPMRASLLWTRARFLASARRRCCHPAGLTCSRSLRPSSARRRAASGSFAPLNVNHILTNSTRTVNHTRNFNVLVENNSLKMFYFWTALYLFMYKKTT